MGGIVLDTGAFYLQRALASAVFSEVVLADLGDQKHYEPVAVTDRYWDTTPVPTIEKQVAAILETTLAGDNNDIKYMALVSGVGGNGITITYTDPGGNNQILTPLVVGNDISLSLATDGGGAITSTSADIIAVVNADADAKLLVLSENKAANDGSGVVTAMGKTNLAGGIDWATITTGFTISYWPGMITFAVAQPVYDDFRASGKKFTITVLAGASECSLDLSKEVKEVTDFQSGKNREYVPGLRGGTGTVSQFYAQTDLAALSALLALDGKLFAVFYQYIGTLRYRIEGEGILTGIPVDMSVGEVVSSKVNWSFTGPVVRTYDPDYS